MCVRLCLPGHGIFFSNQHPDDEAAPVTCEFNHRGTHLAIGDDLGRVDLWSFVPLRNLVKTLTLSPDELPTSAELEEDDSLDVGGVGGGGEGGAGGEGEGDEDKDEGEHDGWHAVSVQWSRWVLSSE